MFTLVPVSIIDGAEKVVPAPATFSGFQARGAVDGPVEAQAVVRALHGDVGVVTDGVHRRCRAGHGRSRGRRTERDHGNRGQRRRSGPGGPAERIPARAPPGKQAGQRSYCSSRSPSTLRRVEATVGGWHCGPNGSDCPVSRGIAYLSAASVSAAQASPSRAAWAAAALRVGASSSPAPPRRGDRRSWPRGTTWRRSRRCCARRRSARAPRARAGSARADRPGSRSVARRGST